MIRWLLLIAVVGCVLTLAAPREVWKAYHGAAVQDLRFSPDGKRLASCGGTFMRLWNQKNGQQLLEFEHEARARRTHFSPKGDRVLTIAIDPWDDGLSESRLYNSKGRRLATLTHAEDESIVGGFAPNGKCLATLTSDWKEGKSHQLRLWDLQGKPIGGPHSGTGIVTSPLNFSPDGRFLYFERLGGQFRLFDTESSREIELAYQSVAPGPFSPDSKQLALRDGRGVRLVKTGDWTTVGRLAADQYALRLAYSAEGLLAVLTVEDSQDFLQVWNPATQSPVTARCPIPGSYHCLQISYSHDGTKILALTPLFPPGETRRSLISVLDARTGQLLSQKTFDLKYRYFNAEWHPKRPWVVAAAEDGMYIWRADDGRPVCDIPATQSSFTHCLSPDGDHLAIGAGQTIGLWRLPAR